MITISRPTTIASRRRAARDAQNARRLARRPSEIRWARDQRWPTGLKRCSACRAELSFTSFAPDQRQFDGLNRQCVPCREQGAARKQAAAEEDQDARLNR